MQDERAYARRIRGNVVLDVVKGSPFQRLSDLIRLFEQPVSESEAILFFWGGGGFWVSGLGSRVAGSKYRENPVQ